ncbi:MAG: hypothetical protein ACR2JK_00965 [Geodermatophilaceae bacterium]
MPGHPNDMDERSDPERGGAQVRGDQGDAPSAGDGMQIIANTLADEHHPQAEPQRPPGARSPRHRCGEEAAELEDKEYSGPGAQQRRRRESAQPGQ